MAEISAETLSGRTLWHTYRSESLKNPSLCGRVGGMALKGTLAFLWSAGRRAGAGGTAAAPSLLPPPSSHTRLVFPHPFITFPCVFRGPLPLPFPLSLSLRPRWRTTGRRRERGKRGLPCHGLIDAPAWLRLSFFPSPSSLPPIRIPS